MSKATISLASACPGFAQGIRPTPELELGTWADDKRYLDQAGSAEPGRWRTSRTPYLREIMHHLSAHIDTVVVTLMFGTQLGKTETGNNWVFYVIDHAPGPMLVVLPRIDDGKLWSQQRFTPAADKMPCIVDRIAPARSRDSRNTTLVKSYDGGVLRITGSNAAAGLRAMPTRYLMLDEIDAYPFDVEGEGDPIELAERRRKTFARSKQLETSTPTEMATSRINQRFNDGSQGEYFVPCPHCGEHQVLDIENLKYELDADSQVIEDSVAMACLECGALIPEHHKTAMLELGEWRHQYPNRKHKSFHLSTLYSPVGWESWAEVAGKAEAAKTNDVLKKTFTNTILGLPFEEKKKVLEAETLKARAEPYPLGICPPGCLVMTAGVDVQDNRLEIVVIGWGPRERWIVDYQVFDGSPRYLEVWKTLDTYLQTPFEHAAGTELRITATAVDSGGHHTNQVYDFCRVRKARKIFAIKGSSMRNKPIIGRPSSVDIDVQGNILKDGGEVYMIGTDTAKDQLTDWLELESSEQDGFVHFSDELPLDFYKHLCAEKKAPRYVKGFLVYDWFLPKGARNEAFDCSVYALAAFWRTGINRWRAGQWKQLEHLVQPPTGDLFGAVDLEQKKAAQAAEVDAVAPAKKSGRRRRRRQSTSFTDKVLNG
ncbi:MAG: phage terminase large subunit family protein [Woeseiaceae bacterium]